MRGTKWPAYLIVTDRTYTLDKLEQIKFVLNTKVSWQRHINNKIFLEAAQERRKRNTKNENYVPAPLPKENAWEKEKNNTGSERAENSHTEREQSPATPSTESARTSTQSTQPIGNSQGNTSELFAQIKSNDKLYFNNYKTYRQDRPTNTRAGGVAIIIKSDIAHRQIKNDNTNSIETVTIELANRVAVTAAYNRPENKFTESDLKNYSNEAAK
ncbi:unnamed protein product [Tenebrio molitor]|nr:unnamed protein product [Tenebrio molitor]